MAEFFTSFPSLDIKPQQGMSVSDMLTIGRGGLQLQKETQANRERLALQNFMSNPANFQDESGNIDMSKVNAAVPKLAPMTGADVVKNLADLSTSQTNATKAKQNLTQEQRALVGQTFNILGKAGVKDRETYMAALDDLVKTNPDNKDLARLSDSYKEIWSKLPDNTPFDQLAIRGAQTLLPVSAQEAQFNPTAGTVATGAGIMPVTTRPSVAGQAPQQIVGRQPLVSTTSTYEPTGRTDLQGNPTAYVRDPATGAILGETTIPAGVPAQAPAAPAAAAPSANVPAAGQAPANAPMRMPAGETPATLDAAVNLRTTARTAAAQVPFQQFNNNQIIKLADQTVTGKGADFVGSLTGGYAALPWTNDNASNLNQLGHYMSLQTASLAQSSGLGGTDAARGIAGQISGTTDWTPQAIKSTARVNRALTTATDLFNQGVDNAFNRTRNPFSSTEFQQRWTQTLGNDGINAIRLYDALRNNDKEGIREVVNSVGGQNSQGYKNLVSKIKSMQTLIGGK